MCPSPDVTMEANGAVEPVSMDAARLAKRNTVISPDQNHHRSRQLPILLLSIGLMVLGLGGPLLNRVYFLHGGSRLWFSSLLQVAGFPVLIPPLVYFYLMTNGARRNPGQPVSALTWRALAALLVLGLLNGLVAYFYAYGTSKLPVSTSSILFATQLAFTAVAAFLLVRQRFTPYSINAIFLLVLGAVVLGLQAEHDRPAGVTNGKYFIGFAMTLSAAALYGVLLPLVELVYGMTSRRPTYTLYLEAQLVMCVVTSVFCLVGMSINRDFRAIPREAAAYGLGEAKYCLVTVFCAVLYQAFGLGYMGVIGCASSLMSGVVLAFLIPFGEILAVILLHEKFTSSKGVSVALAIWGFGSYIYGDWRRGKNLMATAAAEQEVTSMAIDQA